MNNTSYFKTIVEKKNQFSQNREATERAKVKTPESPKFT